MKLAFHPLTLERWADFERLFGERGACGGCWCTYWLQSRSEYERRKGAGNKRLIKSNLRSGFTPGLIAYHDDKPVAWCAVAPRESYPTLARSRVLKPVDDKPVWSLVCFFVRRDYRRRGVSVKLLKAAADHVREQGGRILEGYPEEPSAKGLPDAFAFTGLASAFKKAGFREVARRGKRRPIMRRTLRPRAGKGGS